MSARVYNPMVLSEISKLRSPAVMRRPISGASISAARVKRDLFGPVDKEDSKKFIERELAAQTKVLSKKWGFDFQAGQPMQNHEQYQWERVPPTSAPACLNAMVTLTRAAHVVPQSSTASEDLLDQRAERENQSCFSSIASPASTLESEFEIDSCDPVRTYPLVLRSEKPTSTVIASTTTNPTSRSSNSCSNSSLSTPADRAKRQQRITDYLKERKRLAPSAPKIALAKKARHMLSSSAAPSIAPRQSE